MRSAGTRAGGEQRRPPVERAPQAGGERHEGSKQLVGPVAAARLTQLGDRIAWYAQAVGLERWARLAAVAVVPLLLPEGGLALRSPLVAGLTGYVLLTALARRDRFLRSGDLLVSAAVIMLAGASVVAFLPFLLVTVAGPASRGGPKAGLAAGGTLASVLLMRLALDGQVGEIGVMDLLPIALLLPLAGLTIAAASQVLDDRAVHDRLVLREANRLLSSLRAIADDIPGGLDVSTVSAALVAELRTLPGVDAVVVYVEEQGVGRPTASRGLEGHRLGTLRVDELRDLRVASQHVVDPDELPWPIRRACGVYPHWVALALGPEASPSGIVLAGFSDPELARAARVGLRSVATDGGLALDNARLFDGTRARAADAARRRVAGDLHDGVAQSLAHLRMELELLALAAPSSGDQELSRLARVASGALVDLRGTIAGLSAPMDGDLVSMLRRHVADVQTPHGPTIELDCSGEVAIDADRSEHLLRVAQEAISNAVRHADAGTITVTLERDAATVLLAVEDDGVGRGAVTSQPGGGVGLRSMRERASELGGELEVRDRAGGGTVVALRCPTPAAADDRKELP